METFKQNWLRRCIAHIEETKESKVKHMPREVMEYTFIYINQICNNILKHWYEYR